MPRHGPWWRHHTADARGQARSHAQCHNCTHHGNPHANTSHSWQPRRMYESKSASRIGRARPLPKRSRALEIEAELSRMAEAFPDKHFAEHGGGVDWLNQMRSKWHELNAVRQQLEQSESASRHPQVFQQVPPRSSNATPDNSATPQQAYVRHHSHRARQTASTNIVRNGSSTSSRPSSLLPDRRKTSETAADDGRQRQQDDDNHTTSARASQSMQQTPSANAASVNSMSQALNGPASTKSKRKRTTSDAPVGESSVTDPESALEATPEPSPPRKKKKSKQRDEAANEAPREEASPEGVDQVAMTADQTTSAPEQNSMQPEQTPTSPRRSKRRDKRRKRKAARQLAAVESNDAQANDTNMPVQTTQSSSQQPEQPVVRPEASTMPVEEASASTLFTGVRLSSNVTQGGEQPDATQAEFDTFEDARRRKAIRDARSAPPPSLRRLADARVRLQERPPSPIPEVASNVAAREVIDLCGEASDQSPRRRRKSRSKSKAKVEEDEHKDRISSSCRVPAAGPSSLQSLSSSRSSASGGSHANGIETSEAPSGSRTVAGTGTSAHQRINKASEAEIQIKDASQSPQYKREEPELGSDHPAGRSVEDQGIAEWYANVIEPLLPSLEELDSDQEPQPLAQSAATSMELPASSAHGSVIGTQQQGSTATGFASLSSQRNSTTTGPSTSSVSGLSKTRSELSQPRLQPPSRPTRTGSIPPRLDETSPSSESSPISDGPTLVDASDSSPHRAANDALRRAKHHFSQAAHQYGEADPQQPPKCQERSRRRFKEDSQQDLDRAKWRSFYSSLFELTLRERKESETQTSRQQHTQCSVDGHRQPCACGIEVRVPVPRRERFVLAGVVPSVAVASSERASDRAVTSDDLRVNPGSIDADVPPISNPALSSCQSSQAKTFGARNRLQDAQLPSTPSRRRRDRRQSTRHSDPGSPITVSSAAPTPAQTASDQSTPLSPYRFRAINRSAQRRARKQAEEQAARDGSPLAGVGQLRRPPRACKIIASVEASSNRRRAPAETTPIEPVGAGQSSTMAVEASRTIANGRDTVLPDRSKQQETRQAQADSSPISASSSDRRHRDKGKSRRVE